MGTKSPGGPQRCRLILQRCLAIQLSKPGHTPEDFWMYDSGYMIFQNFLAANAQCWWNAPLTAATRALKYAGHVAPGMLLVTAEPCALEVLRGAYARSVLKPPATYVISSVGDIDDCIVTPTVQGQFTPLPEALCDVIMDLTAEGHSATIENVRIKLSIRFPHMTPPATEVIYDTLAQLMQEQKIYQTSKGYFIFTPERRRSRSRPRAIRNGYQDFEETDEIPQEARTMLMTNAEALHSLYGEISTERDGDLTHQCIQTNLADVICGGNPNDKILYPRAAKRRSASFPTPRSLERRHSLRLFGSSKRLQRCASTRSLSKTYAQTLATDSSSSEYQSTDSSSPKKGSLLSRLFRRSGRAKQRQIETYSAQFPPAEWFNSRAVHLHSVGTQTADHDMPVVHTLSNSTFYDGSELSQRSLTLPRRHRRHMSSDSTFLISSRDCSPIRRRSPVYSSSSLPRSTQSIPATTNGVTSITTAPAPTNKTNHSSATLSRFSAPNHLITTTAATSAVASAQKSSSKSVIGKHIFEQSPSRSSGTLKTPSKRQADNIAMNGYASNLDSGKVSYRSVQSGPSSLESGKASSMLTSGPSSIDSGKVSFSKTSGHSSLDSQCSTNTAVVQPSPARSILVLNGSPRGTPRHQAMRARAAEQSQRQRSSTPSRILEEITNQQTSSTGKSTGSSSGQTFFNGMPNSNSNNSITLQVTTSNGSQSSIPSTKIYVQNSPARSVITLENGKLMENSNVYIINNETTTNEKGEIIKKTLSKQETTPLRSQQQQKLQQPKKNYAQSQAQTHNQPTARHHQQPANVHHIYKDNSISENEANSETCDSISFISETSPDNLDTLSSTEVIDTSKFTKNINNDATMNNSRKLCLQLPQNGSSNIVYKNNVLKNESNPNSPSGEKTLAMAALAAKQDFEIAGSVGNLRFYEKNTKDTTQSKLMNSNCDLKNLNRYESSGNLQKAGSALNSSPSINSGDLAHILQKNMIAVGSEPNLALKDNNCTSASDKSIDKEGLDRRFSLSKDPNGTVATTAAGNEDLYNFPSLTDLSFNFTSLAAQKILQGVSLNSIDTLVELNMAAAAAANKEKQQNNQPTPLCTDYGMV
ncbi:uncharacterized protein LOC129243074 [Anastrepha obliqua]|uniref:uncharacterized protein LOC129243074 n=1 Tax=Anastrepha obliqua TaxID=95512 RepID=UPI0024098272|nr:uncharacterized protein LOC129243074 [Anastrepha obliqua]XP_054736144.1 uncharacterized protein LOC129243074 [Anastrepha obliqua]XP_054736145.1 uncharacterized protein LOC129243074 [Anastrepha obliqua]XP_054736146.1 uncharacterized protein LOC129243074 [Anastrepha obliqua]XP_054736147.1 uncharacterized protein LOC129243074 [Anastrepha obliqua]